MNALRAKRITGPNQRPDRGFTLIETLVALAILLVVAGGMATLYGVSVRANMLNSVQVQLLNSARAKVEQIQSIPYEQVGINAPHNTATGAGYFVYDPYYLPEYSLDNGDLPLSDTVTLKGGLVVTRAVTVEAVDDVADGLSGNDSDGVIEQNTRTILDYKKLTVIASAKVGGFDVTQTLVTILQGSLPSEQEGAVGAPADVPDPPAKLGKVSPAVPVPPPAPPGGCDITNPAYDPPGKKGPGKKGAAAQSGC